MVSRVVLSAIVAIVVGLLCLLLGHILLLVAAPIAAVVGSFLIQWGWALGVLAGLWHFFSGTTWPRST